MKNILIAIVVLVLSGVAGFYAFNSYIYGEKQADIAADYRDAEYVIGDDRITLSDGVHQAPSAPDSASLVTTRYFGNEARGDLDGDGDEDMVFLLTQDGGGSGTFFYLVGAIQEEGGYRGTRAVFLGDRIAPQTTEFRDGRVIVNYADRVSGEAMGTAPTVGKSLHLKYDPVAMDFGEVAQEDFREGMGDSSQMSLTKKTWTWVSSSLYSPGLDGTSSHHEEVKPKEPGVFTLTFSEDGAFSATTDCNMFGGSYRTGSGWLSMDDPYSTKKFCADSQENDFRLILLGDYAYEYSSNGELIISGDLGDGSVIFVFK